MEGYVPDYLCYHDNNWPDKDNVSVNMETQTAMKIGLTLAQRPDVGPTLLQTVWEIVEVLVLKLHWWVASLLALRRCDCNHDDVIKWKHFPRYRPFVRGIHRWPVNSPHKGWWRKALIFSLICAWINGWVNNREAGYLRRHRVRHGVTVMIKHIMYVISEHMSRI